MQKLGIPSNRCGAKSNCKGVLSIPAANEIKLKNMTAAKELDQWFEAEKKNGLVDIKFFTRDDLSGTTIENFAKEALAVIRSQKTTVAPQGF